MFVWLTYSAAREWKDADTYAAFVMVLAGIIDGLGIWIVIHILFGS